jgi:hypothetical protein
MIGFLLLPGRGEREREKNEQVSLFCPHGDELHDIEKLFIEYAWVFYTKAAAPRDAAQRAPGGRRLGGLEPSGPKLLRTGPKAADSETELEAPATRRPSGIRIA